MNLATYFAGVPLRLHVPEFRIASPENPQVNEPNGISIEASWNFGLSLVVFAVTFVKGVTVVPI